MKTDFAEGQLADTGVAEAAAEIRRCVRCGFCTATCPTYVLLGDELDSPRGRIYLIKEMLETDRAPSPQVVKHLDRCLSCLGCETTCPSGVSYRRLIDEARVRVAERYRRPVLQQFWRALLAAVLPHPARFKSALQFARIARPLQGLLSRATALQPLAAMLALAPARTSPAIPDPPPPAQVRGRVAVLFGCAEPVLRPQIRAATVRLLTRVGLDVVRPSGEVCCGAIVHHLGREADAKAAARANVDAWTAEIEGAGLDAIISTAAGCGTQIKDYAHLLRDDPAYAAKAARVSALSRDVCEVILTYGLPEGGAAGPYVVGYQAACSLHHGQRLGDTPGRLLRQAGFNVREPQESHLCCGSAGVYNILEPMIAGQLRARKAERIAALDAQVIASCNIGCLTQLEGAVDAPTVHTVELLDWATGGPRPAGV